VSRPLTYVVLSFLSAVPPNTPDSWLLIISHGTKQLLSGWMIGLCQYTINFMCSLSVSVQKTYANETKSCACDWKRRNLTRASLTKKWNYVPD